MKKPLILTLLIGICLSLSSYDLRAESSQLDSLLNEINREECSFEERYKLLAYTYKFSPEEQIDIFNEVLKYAHDEEDKGAVVSIYNLISSVYTHIKRFEEAQLYSDSALLFKDETANIKALGGVYYQRALLRTAIGEARQLAIDDLYMAISYYEKSPDGARPIIVMLNVIVKYYAEIEDMESIRAVMYDMLERSKELNIPEAYIQTYPIFAQYHSLMYEKHNESAYLDSLIIYSDSVIHTYNALNSEFKVSYAMQMGVSYLTYADALTKRDNVDWDKVEEYITYADELIPETYYIERLQIHVLNSFIASHRQDYLTALSEGQRAEELLDKDPQKSLRGAASTYKAIVEAYRGIGDYESALEYMYKYLEAESTIKSKEQYEVVKELGVKYETAKKDLEISLLNQEREATKYRTTLIISIAIILTVLSLIALLYNRIKRLENERRAIVLASRIEQKEMEYKTLQSETEQRMMRRYLDGRESERKSLAKELHDSVANDVVSIIMQNEVGANSEKINSLLRKTYNHIRQISHQLMPPEFKYISLTGMIKDYTELLNETTPTHFQMDIADSDISSIIEEMPEQLTKEIYYILQEAIGNTLKHADAKNVEIDLHINNNEELIITVADDGKGFDTAALHGGIGLRTMRDRSDDIGAELEIESEIGEGSKVILTLSIDQEQHLPS